MTAAPEFLVLHEFVAPAKKKLKPETWDYLMGGGDTETTLQRNRIAIDSLAFRPRVLCDVGKVSTRGRLIGHDMRLPVILAPIGSLQDLAEGGGVTPARAAASFGVMHMLSSVCKPGPTEVAKAVPPTHPKLYQLYVRGDADWVDGMVAKAIEAGFAGIALTVDLDYYGRRERDLAKRYIPTARVTDGGGDPWQARFTWKDVARIRKKCSVPLMLKGIATPEDALIAVEHGIDVVYVSNHGGRQLDYGRGSLADLPDVVAACKGKAEVIVDGGIMRGTDVVKAIALGANAVGIGRLQGLALAAAGEAGVVRALEILEDEVRRVLGLLGVTALDQLNSNHLAPVVPLPRASWLDSAFPLLKEGY
jgi:isopentenyl diphosphate isomerase/L-lactate dehydrogenase-like FMN-dependent dehydrogenase